MNTTRQTLNELLVKLFNNILAIEENNLRKQNVELSMTEVHILEAVEKSDSNMMSAISKYLMVTQGTLTVSVTRLEKKGYVERIRDDVDRRIVRLVLKDKAKDVLSVHDAFHAQMIDKIVNELDIEEEQELLESLRKVSAFFKEKYSD
ncbi:MAG: MarR family transcriptional regulator [Erysipelotrichaceae bacterium]|nr:MarR family transcriptional regulator [Erysipelotrichaceae bacterium]MCI9524517.1 MarR family transcriptional regulator [Erysipelotrichaceae bacterium]